MVYIFGKFFETITQNFKNLYLNAQCLDKDENLLKKLSYLYLYFQDGKYIF